MTRRIALPLAALATACGGPVGLEQTTPEALSSAPPIVLRHARARTVELGSAVLVGTIAGSVEVENLAYEKVVSAHYTTDGVTWQDAPASYVSSLGDNRERWDFEIPAFEVPFDERDTVPAVDVQFALRYEVAGQTFWDNNGHHDYRVSSYGRNPSYARADLGTTAILVASAVSIDEPWPAYANSWRYQVVVKNLDSRKSVSMVWTPDGWTNTYTGSLRYVRSTTPGVELWEGSGLIPLDATELELAAVMNAQGQSAWDNGEGTNYVLDVPGELRF